MLYVPPSNTTHILQPSEIPFKKLKLEFDKASDKYRIDNGLKVITKHSFAQVLGEAFHETYTPTAIKKAFAVTGIWPFNPSAINPDRLAPSLATEIPAPPPEAAPTQKTRNNKIAQLEQRIQDLEEYIARLEHPGTAPLASILKYPYPKPGQSEKEPQARPKTFKFGTLVTADSITKELQDMEIAKEKKTEDLRLKKELQAVKRAEKAAEKERKKLERPERPGRGRPSKKKNVEETEDVHGNRGVGVKKE